MPAAAFANAYDDTLREYRTTGAVNGCGYTSAELAQAKTQTPKNIKDVAPGYPAQLAVAAAKRAKGCTKAEEKAANTTTAAAGATTGTTGTGTTATGTTGTGAATQPPATTTIAPNATTTAATPAPVPAPATTRCACACHAVDGLAQGRAPCPHRRRGAAGHAARAVGVRALVGVGAALARALAPRHGGGRLARERGVGRVHRLAAPRSLGMAVSLRPLATEHLDDVTALLDDPDVLRFTRLPVPPPPGYARQWLERYAAGRLDGTREAFAALDDDGRFVGLALAVDIDREGREVELGYITAPAARGRGVATAMLDELTRWAFDELGALRVTLIIDVENGASSKVAERCGYVLEGVMRSSYLKDDVRVDAGLWSRLPADP